MIRRQTLIALGIALLLGILAVYLANIYLGRSEQTATAAAENTSMTRIAVAAMPLEYGAEITPEKIKFVPYPAASLPAGSFGSLAEMLPQGKRRVALRAMMINEPVLASKLTGEGQGASLAALLPDGKRAAAVRIDDVSGVAGFVQPSDSVDVLITRGGDGGQITDVLLQNIRVIAIDQNAKDSNGQPVLARTATLEVDAIEAQKLALGQQLGRLSFVLRKPGEQDNQPVVQTVSLDDLRYSMYGGQYRGPATMATARPQSGVRVAAAQPRRVVRRPSAPVVVRPSTRSVEVVRGTQNSNYEVGGYGS